MPSINVFNTAKNLGQLHLTSQVQGMEVSLMGPNILYKNVHTGPRQEQEPDLLSNDVSVPFPILSWSRSHIHVYAQF